MVGTRKLLSSSPIFPNTQERKGKEREKKIDKVTVSEF